MIAIVEGVDLKPCPFCGEQANLKHELCNNGTPPRYWAKCSNRDCGVATMALADQEKATALWQTRA